MNSQANKILIVVGSTRKPKVGAVRDAVASFSSLLAPEKEIEVIGMEVESGVSHTPTSREELMQGAAIMVRIEEVIEAFTDRGDGTARRDRGLEERCDAKLGGGRSAAGDLDHRLGEIDAENLILSLRQLARP